MIRRLALAVLLAMPLLAIAGLITQSRPRLFVAPVAAFVEPSNFELELAYPREVGTSPIAGNVIPFGSSDAFPSAHRTNKAYPGIALDIAAMAIGGALPYEWSLTNAPAGMAINASTGRITWANPTGGPYTITVSVTDAEATTKSSDWTLTVTTTGFYFLDGTNDGSGDTGTISAPFDSLAQVCTAALGDTAILYLRGGTYTPAGVAAGCIATSGGVDGNDELDNNDMPHIWIEYPGETVVYDGLYGSAGTSNAGIGIATGANAYFDGIRITNVKNKLMTVYGGNYKVFKDLTLDGIQDGGGSGSNPGGIETEAHYSTYDYYMHIVGVTASDMTNAGLGKFYSQRKWLIERAYADGTTTIGFDPKGAVPRFEVRYSELIGYDVSSHGATAPIHGNYDAQINESPGCLCHLPIDGEFRFNFVKMLDATDPAAEFGNGAATVYAYRNTIIGRPWSRWVTAGSSPTLHSWYRNVIINGDSTLPDRISITGVNTFSPADSPMTTAPSNVTVSNNLAGAAADNIVNTTTGELQGSYLTQYGPSTATPRGMIPEQLP